MLLQSEDSNFQPAQVFQYNYMDMDSRITAFIVIYGKDSFKTVSWCQKLLHILHINCPLHESS